MQSNAPACGDIKSVKPWYAHRWPWLLLLGPLAVILAGIHTTWIAFSSQDALVVDDYYKQGKAINQDLGRDRVAAALGLQSDVGYDPARGTLSGTVHGLGRARTEKMVLKLIHATQPAKDIKLELQPDRHGNFAVELPMLERARWQVLLENEQRDWRLKGVWAWPQQQKIALKAE